MDAMSVQMKKMRANVTGSCEAGLAKTGDNQNHPVHIKSHFMLCVLRLQNYPFLA